MDMEILEATREGAYPRVRVDWTLGSETGPLSAPISPRELRPEEEITAGPACWLWDYLRRSGQSGFFVPLSGGRDSAAVVCLVYSMARLLAQAVANGDAEVESELKRVAGLSSTDPRVICGRLLQTAYLATSNSSTDTRDRARGLAEQIGARHSSVCCRGQRVSWSVVIDEAVSSILRIFTESAGRTPKFAVEGGESRENLALQNVQARVRMVTSYLFAQLGPWSQDKPGGLLVLATGNVDEGLRGYLTKYDCSSGDINPIGSISKMDLDAFLRYAMAEWGLDTLKGILDAPPTAELVPLKDGLLTQTDEDEMGMTYRELSEFGRHRLPGGCGPYSMFLQLADEWADRHTPAEVGKKVMHFFRCYAVNRHKATVSTPAVHAETYSPDDHRHDHRPFLYNVAWPWQFARIRQKVKEMEEARK